MDKCWFVFRQPHYPAPVYKLPGMAHGKAEGPLLLGHLIPGPRKVDEVINSGGIVPFPRDMRIYPTKTADFRLSDTAESEVESSAKGSAPIAAAAGVNVSADAGTVFRRMMGYTWEVDHLETQIVQPTLAYLEDCRQSPDIKAWIEHNKTFLIGTWTVYMISGLMIARGAKNKRKETSETEQNMGGSADVSGVASIEGKVKHGTKKELEISGVHTDDFVWAIRLTEVSKNVFRSTLAYEALTQGATLAPSLEKVDIDAILADEGLHLGDGGDVRPVEVVKETGEQLFLIGIDGH
ncbi:hypothetical protein B0T19DRAFT_433244 [Cercophora scortea]|uniref:Uncharacterized protein n=1 Tax=Cercophora scortea TaxID=314031 RepID=A0AAE0I7E9_9PEZI|nr:hypothetical protein B0T19DRAFT_433244 [Cercophora scortea]